MFKLERLLILVLFMIMFIGMPVFAQQQISGPQSGTLGPGTYLVVGDISVQSGDSLEIVPGTTFLHNGNHKWLISGKFAAAGTTEDSIYFIRQDPVPGHRWAGLRFESGAPVGELDYCVIDHCYIEFDNNFRHFSAVNVYDGQGLILKRSRISSHFSNYYGGGVYVHNGSVLIDSCLIIDNYQFNHDRGVGIYLSNCTSDTCKILRSTIAHNICNISGM